MSKSAASGAARTERLQLRATARQGALIRAAAAVSDRNVTDFVLDAATTTAARTVAEQRWWWVDAAAYDEFLALLDAPPGEVSGLDDLFARPRPDWLDG